MRVRTKDELSPVQSNWHITNNGCSTNYSETSLITVGTEGSYRQTTDTITPDYSKRRRAGEIIVNPFNSLVKYGTVNMTGPSYTKACGGGVGNSLFELQDNYINRYTGVSDDFNMFTAEELRDAGALAATDCWANVNREETQLLVTLAELKRTISMLQNPIANFRDFFTRVKKIKNASPRYKGDLSLPVHKYMAREWLTWRYGWLQLYRDLYNTLQALKKNEASGLLRAFGSHRIERETQENFVTESGFSSVVGLNWYRVRRHTVYVRSGIYYEGSLKTNSYLGVTPEAVVDAYWELIPYSFVIDWALGVQSYIKGLIRHLSVPIKGSFTTYTHVKSCVVSSGGAYLRPGQADLGWSISKDASGTSSWITRQKTRNPGISPPQLRIQFPFRDLADIRILDSLALLINLANKK